MKKTIAIILASILILSAFTSCNLDNEGILHRGPGRTVSDNKNRDFIGLYGDSIYFASIDGLEKGDFSDNSTVISGDPIFLNHHPDLSWITSSGQMIYMDDTADGQKFYSINMDNGAKTELSISGITLAATERYVAHFSAEGTDYLVTAEQTPTSSSNEDSKSKGGAIYSIISLVDSTLTLNKVHEAVDNYLSCVNGLVSSRTFGSNGNVSSYSYYYLGTPVTFTNTEGAAYTVEDDIKAFFRSGNNIYAVRSISGDNIFTILKGTISDSSVSMQVVTSVSGAYNREFPCIVYNNMLYFLDWNGSSSASRFYSINIADGETDRVNYTTTSNGIEAEAFFEKDGTIYMLSKDHGLFRVNGTSLERI